MTADTSSSQRVLIVGGGIAGLSIAVRLRQAGRPVTLLEAAQTRVGASSRNQGWLYSGGWFARHDAELARQCYDSLQRTLQFCPECVEPDHAGMIYLLAESDTLGDEWMSKWQAAAIPFERLDRQTVLDAIPHWNEQKLHKAWRLPDRAIQPDMLLSRLTQTAEALGVDVRTGTPVRELLKTGDRVAGVLTAGGEEQSRLVILATGGDLALRSDASTEEPGEQSDYQLVSLKTHLRAIQPRLCSQPFCVLDHEGFNHIPHAVTSIFGSNHWTVVSRPNDATVEPKETQRIADQLTELLPTWNFPDSGVREWAGTVVQAMHLDQMEPGRATLPTVIDHATEPGGLKNLLSVYPGRASLWPQLAEMTLDAVNAKRDVASKSIAEPPWQNPE